MKKLTIILGVAIMAFAACDELEDLNTKTFEDLEVSQSITIDVEEPATKSATVDPAPIAFTKKLELSLNDVSEIKDYLSHIENMDITEVSCKVTNIADDILETLTFSVSGTSYSVTVDPIVVGQSITLNFTSEQLNEMAQLLIEDKKLTLNIGGTVFEAPVSFNIKAILLADVTVKLIN